MLKVGQFIGVRCWFLVLALLAAATARSGDPQAGQGSGQGAQTDLTPKQVYEQARDSVVRIECDKVVGSGFFVKSGCYVVTCFHVVEGGSSVIVRASDGVTTFVPDTVCFDRGTDVAVLHLSVDSGKRPIRCGLESALSVGDPVFVIGNPLGFLSDSLSCGIVSGRRVDGDVHFIQTSAAISHGSSGSPLLNGQAQVVGVINGSYEAGQSLNMAVAIQHAKVLLDKEFQPLSALKTEAPKVEEAKKAEPTEEENKAVAEAECVRGSELIADYWGGIGEALIEWENEWGRDIAARSLEPEEQTPKQWGRARSVLSAAAPAGALVQFLRQQNQTDGELPRAFTDAEDAVMKLAGELADARSVLCIKLGQVTGSKFEVVNDAATEASKRLDEAHSSIYAWARRQGWFRSGSFFAELSGPVLAVHFPPYLADVSPDGLLKGGCFVAEWLGGRGGLKRGDRITGLRLVSADGFESVETWRDVRSKLLSYTEKPDRVSVRVVRDGAERTEIVEVHWPK